MDRWLGRRWVLALVSLLLAGAVWAAVVSQADPIVERSFAAVPVRVTGGGAHVSAAPKTVRVVVEGPASLLATLSAAQLQLLATDPGAGGGLAPVVLVGPAGAALVEAEPSQVRITP